MGDELKQIAMTLEAKMLKQYNKMKVLRALCLFSTTQGGLTKLDFDNLRRVFIMCYGYQEIVTLMNLQEAGLLKEKNKKAIGYFDWNWNKIKESYQLVNEEFDFRNPDDISYVFNGCAPLSVRIIELVLKNSLSAMSQAYGKSMLKLVGLTDDKIRIPANEGKFFNPQSSGNAPRPVFKARRILIYFIGGITYAEIAAIRHLQNLNPQFKFIIATTSIINGESALTQLLGPSANSADQSLLLGEII